MLRLLFPLLSSLFIPCSSVKAVKIPSTDSEVVLDSDGHVNSLKQPASTKSDAVNAPFKQLVNGSTPTGWIQVGTPKKWLLVIFDTGSDKLVAKTWETVAKELNQVDQGVNGMVKPSKTIYDHSSSSSYEPMYMKDPITGKKKKRQSQITYGSGAAITDDGKEIVLVGNRNLENFTIMEIRADSLQLLHDKKGIAGVLGLQHMKNKSLGRSLFSQMRDAGLLTSFGYCRDSGNNGTFIWGDDSKEGKELDVIGDMHWAVKLGSLEVQPGKHASKQDDTTEADKPKQAEGAKGAEKHKSDSGILSEVAQTPDVASGDADDGSVDKFDASDSKQQADDASAAADVLTGACKDNGCIGILDTGSNIIAGPSKVMKAITQLVNVKPDCSNFNDLPPLTMTFGGMDVTIQPSGYVMKIPMPKGGIFGGDGKGDGGAGALDSEDGGSDEGGAADSSPSLSEEQAGNSRSAADHRWRHTFKQLHKNYGVDLRDQLDKILKMLDAPAKDFLCMPALVPLDKKTKYGPLFVVGTPLLDSYYARWSFDKGAESPKIHLKDLKTADTCKNDKENAFNSDAAPPSLMRRQKEAEEESAADHSSAQGPIERRPEEIAYPHWAKDLLHV